MKRVLASLLFFAAPVTGLADTLPRALTDDDFIPVSEAEARLGWLLFYDPILSGNRNISCASCHHPRFATSDGVSLTLGEGGIGLGPDRYADPDNIPERRLPRNATALFNLGARDLPALFHDGRIELDPTRKAGFRTPLEDDMATGFSGIVSAQTMFPVLSQDEMAGHYSENDISQAVRQGRITGKGGAWDIIARRVSGIPDYADDFLSVYPDLTSPEQIHFTDISNAIAAFMAFEWRSDDSAFDRHLRGEAVLTGSAAAGMELFFGDAGCGTCHSGPFLTDHSFHAMGVPQIGPGKVGRFERHSRDEGRFRVTADPADLFAFRTPPLRNVARTGPWGHDGAYSDLSVFLAAHVDPQRGSDGYDRAQAILPSLDGPDDFAVLDEPVEMAAVRSAAVDYRAEVSAQDRRDILAFLESLTDDAAIAGRLGVPDRVPSGLEVER
ncbi:cytochrome-c peroxidase [Meridianimarinicoccus aquatilis]|uniref:Cytochrome-c peroxidase n=1 Tax=Meridianimarinicoccus aquatilis TaxID=2552766 RepID=A0A4R6B1D5_9RHOB|nr:cytochrome c peroxidase [Fluviibacterium aquatile]TDL90467.1 cytochrome-c peroxidase [Fluviibacterium aquatile]